MDKKKLTEVIKKKTGYYQLKKKPSSEELRHYYNEKYYQDGIGSYEKSYSKGEVEYIKNRQKTIFFCLHNKLGHISANQKLLDLGCGEGWALKHFYNNNWQVTGVDYSAYGVKKFNPEMEKYFSECDIYSFLDHKVQKDEKYNVILLNNVIEHVLNPEELLDKIRLLLDSKGTLVVTFPNDFSALHELLLVEKKIDKPFWIVAPDHISYFTKKSFEKMACKNGYDAKLFLADFPIDLFLLNDHSNYIEDKTKGKQAHLARVNLMNMLNNLDFESSVEAFLDFGNLGFGRDLTVFLKLKN